MGASNHIVVLACAFVVGCAPSVPVGLANAPVLGGATVETRVHDVIANGRDSCERSAFPQGEVLRGHIPPCVTKEPAAGVPALLFPAQPRTSSSPGYPLGACPNPWSKPTGAEKGMAAISLSLSGELACGGPW
jgi:hypothetical protein